MLKKTVDGMNFVVSLINILSLNDSTLIVWELFFSFKDMMLKNSAEMKLETKSDFKMHLVDLP